MVSKKDITIMGKTIKEYIGKNKKLPASVLVKGTKYTVQEATYLMCAFVENPDLKDYTKIKVGGAKAPTGERINRKVNKENYQNMAERCKQYIKGNGRLPNYVTILSQQKCSIILFILQLAKICAAYNGKLPDNVLINSADIQPVTPKPTGKKYGRSTETGCDNRGQNNGYFCGPHMVQEIIRNLTGKVISQSTLAGVIGTTSDGSDHEGINFAFSWFNKNYGYNLKVEWKNFNEVGWNGIKKILESTNQDCGIHELYRNNWGHYTNFDRVYNETIDVHNSLGSYCNYGCYCGYTENRTKSEAESYLRGISQKSVIIVTRG